MVATALAMGILGWSAPKKGGHFNFCGPITHFMAEGFPFSKITSGHPFIFEITPNGRVEVLGDTFNGKNWKGSVTIDTLNLSFSKGTLATEVKLFNKSGGALEGVRLDFVEAVESYKAKDASGNGVIKERPVTVKTTEPLYLGDIEDRDDCDTQRFRASGLEMKPETQKIQLRCVVSGYYYAGAFTLASGSLLAAGLDFDPQGRLVVADRREKAFTRLRVDGTQPESLGALSAPILKFAVSPTTGEIAATVTDGRQIQRLSNVGKELGALPATPGGLRFDAQGALYVGHGGIAKYVDGKEVGAIDATVRGHKIGPLDGFDIDPNGAIWTMASGTLLKIEPDLKSSREIADGPDWRFGRLTPHEDSQVRCDRRGAVYVSEYKTADEAYRISVFDNEGRFVRIVGRGGHDAKPNAFLRGQLPDFVTDMAIGPDGTLYVGTRDPKIGVMMFTPI